MTIRPSAPNLTHGPLGPVGSLARADPGVRPPMQPEQPEWGYLLRAVPPERQPVLDRLAGASRRFQVHALLELDVTDAKSCVLAAEPRVSWTAFVIASVARAVALHPEVNSRIAGSEILYFDRIDVGATGGTALAGAYRAGHRDDPRRGSEVLRRDHRDPAPGQVPSR